MLYHGAMNHGKGHKWQSENYFKSQAARNFLQCADIENRQLVKLVDLLEQQEKGLRTKMLKALTATLLVFHRNTKKFQFVSNQLEYVPSPKWRWN